MNNLELINNSTKDICLVLDFVKSFLHNTELAEFVRKQSSHYDLYLTSYLLEDRVKVFVYDN
jgi:hypothetical protein